MSFIYVPVLKAKQGEFAALKELAPAVLAKTFPIFDVAPVPWDYDNDVAAKSVDDHLAKLPDTVLRSIGAHPTAFDLTWLDASDRLANGSHPVSWLFSQLRARGVIAQPVVGPGPRYDADYVKAVAAEVATDKRGAVVRIAGQSLLFDPALGASLAALCSALALAPSSIDLLVDLEGVDATTYQAVAIATGAILRGMQPPLGAWRSVIVASSSFPKDLSAYIQGVHGISRACLSTWDAMRSQQGLPRLPVFGDYVIDHFDRVEPEVSPRLLKGSTNLRYTVSRDWLVFKGPNWKDNSFLPMQNLCAQLVVDPQFSGPNFSAGDAYIQACATGGPTGNATTWRRVGVNHHVTFVVTQLATLHAASAASGRPLSGPQAEPLP